MSRGFTERFLSRRSFVKAALAIGGAGALSACIEREGMPDVPQGARNPATEYGQRQFGWNGYLPRDGHGNTKLPNHQLILFLNYAGEGEPTPSDRQSVEGALATLDRAYERGNGGVNPYQPGGAAASGLLYTMGYSRHYFDRFEASLPENVDLPYPAETLEAVDDDPAKGDDYDAALVLSSDHVPVLLACEQALYGNLQELNGLPVRGTFSGVLETADRRTGFVGQGLPHKRLDVEGIPERAPLSMGFKSGFHDNQASEDSVAIESGPFADGTTQHISRLEITLEDWYGNDREDRVEKMFSPEHSAERVGDAGERLADQSQISEADVDRIPDDAAEHGRIGHTQKVAAARDENFEPLILRRSEGVSTGSTTPGFNFSSVQRAIEDFVEVRKAMNGDDVDVPDEEQGIDPFLEVKHRANFLIPPRRHRSLPTARPEAV